MHLRLTFISNDIEKRHLWESQLKQILTDWPIYQINQCDASRLHINSEKLGQVLLLDSQIENLEEVINSIDRKDRAFILLLEENEPMPALFFERKVDSVLVYPFRAAEVLGVLKIYEQVLLWEEVSQLNHSFSGLIEQLHEDLKLAERLQKLRLPRRFADIKGFQIQSRYLAGMKSGGEYFDLNDAEQKGQISLLLTDSSSYGLSSALLSVLMRVASKIAVGQNTHFSNFYTVKSIYDEILLTLSEKDELSLLFGNISKTDLAFNYLNLGNGKVFHSKKGENFRVLPSQGGVITRKSGLPETQDLTVQLAPDDRLVLLSDGFIEAAGGDQNSAVLLNKFRNTEPADTLNELVYQVKSKLPSDDEMPDQDCTGIVVDINSNIIRLTK